MLRNVQKSVRHVQSCCFANLNLLPFCRSRCRRRRRCLSSRIKLCRSLARTTCSMTVGNPDLTASSYTFCLAFPPTENGKIPGHLT